MPLNSSSKSCGQQNQILRFLSIAVYVASRLLFAIGASSAIFLPALANSPERGELIAHPNFSLNGCPLDKEWTDQTVSAALGLQPRMLNRLSNRFSITKERLCNSTWYELEAFLRNAQNPKHNADKPDQALLFRAMQLRDESGKVAGNGLIAALKQRGALIGGAQSDFTANAAGISSASWTWLGPGNIGGRVRAISPHPTTPNDVMIGSVSGGVWRTTNGGASWNALDDFMPSVAVTYLVRDPSAPNTVYACTGEGFFNVDAARGLGIFKSTDNGATWDQVTSTNPSTGGDDWYFVNRLAISPVNPQVMLAATNGGVYRTANGGVNWVKVYGAGANAVRRVLDIAFHPTDGNIALLGEGYHLVNSTGDGASVANSVDGGVTWNRTKLNASAITSPRGRVEIAFAKSNPSIVYAMVDVNNGELYKSVNAGATWAFVSNPNHLGQGWYDNALWVAPNDSSRIISGGVSMIMSINGGLTWTSVGNSVHADHHALVSDPSYATNFTIYGGNDGGVYKATGLNTGAPSTSSPAWVNLNNGLGITQFYGGAGRINGAITGGTQDNGSLFYTGGTNCTVNCSTDWVRFFGGDGGDSAADPTVGSNIIFGETGSGAVVRYLNATAGAPADGGQAICTGIADADCFFGQNPSPRINFIAPLKIDPNNSNTMLLGAERLWRSNNVKTTEPSQVSWNVIKEVATSGNYISAISIAPSNSNLIWVGYNNGDLWCTANGTAAVPNWTKVSGAQGRMVMRITIDDTNNSRVFVAYGGFSSPNLLVTNGGCSGAPGFSSIHNQLPAAPIRAITRHPVNANWLYAGTEVGLFTSENGGASWTTSNDGPGTVSVEEIFFLDNINLVVATHGRGMFRSVASSGGAGLFQLSNASQKVVESVGSITVTVNRTSGNTGAVSVSYSSASGSAASGTDFAPVSGVLVWADGEAGAKTFNVPILSDAIIEPEEKFTVGLSAPTGGATLGAPSTHTVTIVDSTGEIFPKNCALPTAGWSVPSGAQTGWSVALDTAAEGNCSLKSNPITDFQNARIQFSGNFVLGNISFARRVSSEAAFDCFRFLLDGVQQAVGGACDTGSGASGLLDWANVTIPVTAGQHTLTWSYEKDDSNSAGSDAAWIDNVSLPLFVVPKTNNSDLNGDGKSDLIVQSTGGTVTEWLMDGTVIASVANLLLVDPNWTITHIADFNGDGKADILWRSNEGAVTMWLMNGNTIISAVGLLGPDANWRVSHVGDFNGDGKADLLWRNTNGAVTMWLMNGTAITSTAGLIGPDANWSVSHVGDFNGDGKADLLWRNTNGAVTIWLMSGTTTLSAAGLLGPDPNWSVSHTADFNGDGKADLLWRSANGAVTIWLMNGAALSSAAGILGANPDWRISHTGDFNGDGNADLLWRNNNGAVTMWLMDGATTITTAGLIGADANWRVSHINDLNGDGKADLIWRNLDGSITAWVMNGTSPSATAGLTGAGTLKVVP
jgi:Calx-beta domain/FG-GAP-like repeat